MTHGLALWHRASFATEPSGVQRPCRFLFSVIRWFSSVFFANYPLASVFFYVDFVCAFIAAPHFAISKQQ